MSTTNEMPAFHADKKLPTQTEVLLTFFKNIT